VRLPTEADDLPGQTSQRNLLNGRSPERDLLVRSVQLDEGIQGLVLGVGQVVESRDDGRIRLRARSRGRRGRLLLFQALLDLVSPGQESGLLDGRREGETIERRPAPAVGASTGGGITGARAGEGHGRQEPEIAQDKDGQ
jgi:hypothetical protein